MMNTPHKETILFVSSTCKGEPMLRVAHELNCYVLLLTEEKLRDDPFPYDIINETFYTPDLAKYRDVIHTVAYLCRGRQIDRIIPLDEFEVELVGMLREHLRLPGMGVSAVRQFRDKLTMRELTHQAGIRVPDFVGIKNYDRVRDYMAAVNPPWVLKPRMEASAMGIEKIQNHEQLWRTLDKLGDLQSYYLLEQFVPGDVYHADSITVNGKVVFVSVQKYGAPPLQIYQGGGVFNTRVLPDKDKDVKIIKKMNEKIIKTLGMENGVTHTEFIKAHADGEIYFLESAARVGGANISDLIEQATDINLWREWGRLEIALLRGEKYELPPARNEYAGLLMTLARQEHPDLSAYHDPEVREVPHLKKYHAGLMVASAQYERVEDLLTQYTERFIQDFSTRADPWGTQRTGVSG
jgi:biotin carboxylase